MHDTEHPVVIAGGGPSGLVLAAELHLAGVPALIVEPRLTQELDGSRAGGLHARTIEVLDQRGIAERFLQAGQVMQTTGYAYTILDLSDFPTRHPYGLALWQSEFERILADWVLGELGVAIRRGCRVTGLQQDADGVDVELSDGTQVRARYLVGCDGGRSTVRKAAGIAFPGLDAATSWMIAEVEMEGEPQLGFHRDEAGRQQVLGQRQPGEPVRAVLTEPTADRTKAPTMDELRAALIRIYGSDFGLRSASWISWFTDASRQAAEYRRGRVLLAGDAAHIHPPQGGQGMNLGVQDAVNLGWKLALVASGAAPDALLDSYHDERHPVGERVLAHSASMVALATPGDRHEALRRTVAELVVMEGPRRRLAGQLSGLDIRYDLGGDHPFVGWRMPDLDLSTAAGPTRVASLLSDARPLLLDLRSTDGAEVVHASSWGDRVGSVRASADGPWLLPDFTEVPPPDAVLVRPDGHVAWAGDPQDPSLAQALQRWFGVAST